MYKYKYFPLFFGLTGMVIFLFLFPVSFDNNDDQSMYFICSGILSGTRSPNILLSNILIGRMLNYLFLHIPKINWYTLYLLTAQGLSFLAICYTVIKNRKISNLEGWFFTAVFLLGFGALCIAKLEFTTVALFCCFAALFFLEAETGTKQKFLTTGILLSLAILIRKEIVFTFILFSIPVFLNKVREKDFIPRYIGLLLFALGFFILTMGVNNKDNNYQKNNSYAYLNTLDIIAAKPSRYNEMQLMQHHFSRDDMTLLQNWFPCDDGYLSGQNILKFGEEIKSVRNINELFGEFEKFATDERYVLAMYLLSILIVLFFARESAVICGLNLIAFVIWLSYLAVTSRIPHRITFPVITYVILVNIYFFLKGNNNKRIKHIVLTVFLLISSYKFYCVTALYTINKENHRKFEQCRKEINAHPDYLFIGLYDGLPLQFMNAWQTPETFFPNHNLILTGWYACSPDYIGLLQLHQLKNLTSDLKDSKNIFLLTDFKNVEMAYAAVLAERYHLKCHFENAGEGFKELHPKRLIFDN